jgi:hypothetical protein
MTNQIQRYNPPGGWKQRPQRRNGPTGPRCPACHSTNVRPFSAIYGFGTTNFLRRRGLIVPHAFERTTRQSVIALKCAPPQKLPWSILVVCVLLSFGLACGGRPLPRIVDLIAIAEYWMLWISLCAGLVITAYNLVVYPNRLAAWSRKLYCQQCGTAFDDN